MKKALTMAAIALSMAACTEEQGKQLVKFDISGFSIMQEEMTKSTPAEANMTDIWIYDLASGSPVELLHQTATDDNFGTPELLMDYGQHSLTIVASRGENPTYGGGNLTWTKPRDTYGKVLPLEVSTSTTSVSAALPMRAAALKLVPTDAMPDGTTRIEIAFDQSKSMVLASTQGTAVERATTTLNYTQSHWGTHTAAAAYSLCPSAEAWQTEVEVTVYGAGDAVISHFIVPNVPMQQNHRTVLTGEVYGRTSGMTITLEDGWEDDGMNF